MNATERHKREEVALGRLGEHCASCPACMTVTDTGENANLPCVIADRLYEAWRQTRRGPVITSCSQR